MIAAKVTIFALTFLVEYFIIWLFLRKQFSGKKLVLLGYVFLINLFTWPLANFIFIVFGGFWMIELGIILAESYLIVLLMDIKFRKALLIAFVANTVTALLSFLSFLI